MIFTPIPHLHASPGNLLFASFSVSSSIILLVSTELSECYFITISLVLILGISFNSLVPIKRHKNGILLCKVC